MRKNIYFYLFFFLIINVSFCDVFDHLKKAEGKTDNHKMRNIDFIYMINLDRRPEKFAKTTEHLKPFGIFPYRFSAVNGWELSSQDLEGIGLRFLPGMQVLFSTTFPIEAEGKSSHGLMTEYGKTYFAHGMTKGAIGVTLSHLSILQDAWESGFETIWILEDDVIALKDPNVIPDLIDELDNIVGNGRWDVLFTDIAPRGSDGKPIFAYGAAKRPDMDCSIKARYSEKYTQKKIINHNFEKITARFGSYSMIIRRSGMKKILDFYRKGGIFLPYDMEYYLPNDIQHYSLTFDLVTNDIFALSDNSKPLY